jgi:anaerobic glycerol-3-phosphate dehydrogenase|tara:strand:+ start:275 stop:574 length:300 start_codon:yes stop_codon:yes gene_type:complete
METANEQRAQQSARLDRIEEKIDKLCDAIISLARAEEKIATMAEFGKQQGEQLLTLINRVDKLDQVVRENQATVNIINKLFWIVMASAATAITGMLFIK